MNISKPFIERPVATVLLTIALFLVGVLGYRALPISALPSVDYPTIQVVTLYPGASPDITASAITSPLETQLGQVSGLTQMMSQSSNGVSVITLQFDLQQQLDKVQQDVQAAINSANSNLPADLLMPPVYHKVNPADPPILTLSVASNDLPMTQVQDLVNTRVAQKLAEVSGVGLITLSGGQKPAVRIHYNPDALAALGMDAETIHSSISAGNVNQAKGNLSGPTRASTINANDQLNSVEDYQNLVIAYKNGAPVRLKDIAEVSYGAEDIYQIATVNHQAAILVQIQKQPGANVIATADQIKRILPQLQENLPASVKMNIISDRTDTIRASIEDVRFELLLAIFLVIAVIFVFLRNLPATIIPGIAVPLSLVGTFAAMYALGFSVNNLTLMALTIATGFVVDDAIVVIENIARHLEAGMKPVQAALKGAGEIGFTIVSLTFSLVAVLIPLLFMPDIIGRLFREFAVTLAVAILISAVISLVLTPMMCAFILKPETHHHAPRWILRIEAFLDRVIAGYGRWLRWVLDRQRLTLTVAAGIFALTLLLFWIIPKGFFPLQDNSQILVMTDDQQSASFADLTVKQEQAAQIILRNPNVASVTSSAGIDGANPSPISGRLQIQLKPLSQRHERAPAIMDELKTELGKIPGLNSYLQVVQDLTVDTTVSRAQYQFSLQAGNMNDLEHWNDLLVQRLHASTALHDVNSDLQTKGLISQVVVDRDSAARLGVTASAIDTALYNAFGQRQISTVYTQTNLYRVVVAVNPQQATDPSALEHIHVLSTGGQAIPLLSVARIEQTKGAIALNRLDQFPVANISFNLADDASMGDAVREVNRAKTELNIPNSVTVKFQGSTQAFDAALSNEVWLIVAAVVVMYIVLGVLYESYIHPLTILSTLPTAGVGALLALMLARQDLSIIGIIGIILLIGIVKKNAIMMIDFALSAEREEGLSPREAIYQACLLRFRPILMTTMAALFSAIPLMLSTGVGAELRRPLGITMFGGLIFSQLITLFTTPVVYLAFDRVLRRWRARTNPTNGNNGTGNTEPAAHA